MKSNYLKLQAIINFANSISKFPYQNDALLGTQYCLFFLGFMAGAEQHQKQSQIYIKAQYLLKSINTEILQGQTLEQLEILIEEYINGQKDINLEIPDDIILFTSSNQQKDFKKAIIGEIKVNEFDNKVQQNQLQDQPNYFPVLQHNPQQPKRNIQTLQQQKQDFKIIQKDHNKQAIPQNFAFLQKEKKEQIFSQEQYNSQRYPPFNNQLNEGQGQLQKKQETYFQNQHKNQQNIQNQALTQNKQNQLFNQKQNQKNALFDFEENKKQRSSSTQQNYQHSVQSSPKKRIKITEIKEEELIEIAKQGSQIIKDQLYLQFIDQQKQKSIILKNQRLNQQTNECTICLEKLQTSEFITLSCQDAYHKDCLKEFANSQKQFPILCPNQYCKKEILLDDLKIFCKQQLLQQLENASFNIFLQQNPQIFQCPTPDCTGLYEIEGPNQLCLICKNIFCTKCKRLSHDGVCGEASFIKLANKEKYRQCVKCQRWVEKISGCEHIKCSCGFEFCYICGKNWGHGHICNSEQRNTGLFQQIIQPQTQQRRNLLNFNQLQEQNARLRNYGLLQIFEIQE